MSIKTEKTINFTVENPLILMFGPRRSGKSFWMKNYVDNNIKKFAKITIFKNSDTESDVADTSVYGDNKKIEENVWDLKKLYKFIELAKYFKKKRKTYKMMLIFDDVLDSLTDPRNRGLLIQIASRGRHWNKYLQIWILSQSLGNRLIEPLFVDNLDYLIITKIPMKSREDIRKTYIPDKNEFEEVEKHLIQKKYSKIVYDYVENIRYFI